MEELKQLRRIYKNINSEHVINILDECIQENPYIISLNLLNVFKYDERKVYMICYELQELLESDIFKIETKLYISYNKNKIIFYLKGKYDMNNQLTKLNFVIPYGYRDKYINFIDEVNQSVSNEYGEMVMIFANNIPYTLELILYVQTYEPEKIRKIAKKYNVNELQNGKSLEYYLTEQMRRQWNVQGLIKKLYKEDISRLLENICNIKTIKQLEEEGYLLEHKGEIIC